MVGANVTPRLQVVPEVKLAGQGAVTEKGAVVVWLVMLRSEPPVFVIAAVRVRLGRRVGLIFRVPNFSCAGMILTVPGTRVTLIELALVLSVIDVAASVTLALAGTAVGAA